MSHHLFGTLFALIFCSDADNALFLVLFWINLLSANLTLKYEKNHAKTELSNGAIWEEFIE